LPAFRWIEFFFRRPGESRDPYAAAFVLKDAGRRLSLNHSPLWLWVPAPVRNCAQGGDDVEIVARHTFAFSPHHPREFLWEFLPSNIERAQGMPARQARPQPRVQK
jgi:hypothetical protein